MLTSKTVRVWALTLLVAATVVSCGGPDPSQGPRVTARWEGGDRYATAVQVSRSSFPLGSDLVVLASGEDYADALVGAPAAHAFTAPLLLTRRTALDPSVAEELVRLGTSTVVVLGGTGAVSDAVVDQLEAAGLVVRRVAGADRYDTAAQVALTLVSPLQTGGSVLVASGSQYADAVSAGALGAAQGSPLLFAGDSGLPDATREALTALAPRAVIVVGGDQRVPEGVLRELRKVAPQAKVTRTAGDDRYATSMAVQALMPSAAPQPVLLATGSAFADALAGSALGVPLLLVRPECIPRAVAGHLVSARPAQLVALGGTTAISEAAAAGTVCP